MGCELVLDLYFRQLDGIVLEFLKSGDKIQEDKFHGSGSIVICFCSVMLEELEKYQRICLGMGTGGSTFIGVAARVQTAL